MGDYLLVGWEQIHREYFLDKNGNPVISISTLRTRYGPEMKRLGVVFEFNLGRVKRKNICAWTSMIKNYFIKRQQVNYDE